MKHVAQRFGYANTTISFLDLSESAFAMQPGLVQAECRMLVMFLCMLSMLPIQNWKFQQMDSRSCSINIQSDLVLIWKHVISPITKIFLTNKTTMIIRNNNFQSEHQFQNCKNKQYCLQYCYTYSDVQSCSTSIAKMILFGLKIN